MSQENEIKILKLRNQKLILHINAQNAYLKNLENAIKHLNARVDEQSETIRLSVNHLNNFTESA